MMMTIPSTAFPVASLSVKPCFMPSLGSNFNECSKLRKLKQRSRWLRDSKCRAVLSDDAPVAMAIGACILNSLVFPPASSTEDMEGESLIDSTDARFAVMGIISFIPYFNWMSWVFAWLDTGNRRYAVYAIVYLAPYLRWTLSISPDESWLPISSIFLCIIHIQLEASMKNGDLQGFQVLSKAVQSISSITQKKDDRNSEEDHHNLPSAQEDYRNQIKYWNVSQKSSHDQEDLIEDTEDDG